MDLVLAIENFEAQLMPKTTRYYWFDIYVMNQHCADEIGGDLLSNLRRSIETPGKVLLLLDSWRDPAPLARCWCLFELYTAIQCGADITMCLGRDEEQSFTSDLDANSKELDELIRAVGFHNNKVKFIKATTRLLVDEHDSTVPDTLEALTALPGVGPKMALICLNVCFDKIVGISVDTHVHRISNQLGWTGGGAPTKNPEATRAALESWMPFEVWGEVNLLLVGLGQEVQTEKAKLLRKALACSDPPAALRLLEVCGVDVAKEGAKHGIDVPA